MLSVMWASEAEQILITNLSVKYYQVYNKFMRVNINQGYIARVYSWWCPQPLRFIRHVTLNIIHKMNGLHLEIKILMVSL